MPRFLHTDLGSGLSYYSDDTPDGKTVIRSEQDVEPVLDAAKERRNSGSGDKKIADNLQHYCTIPNSVWLQLLQKGIDPAKLNDLTMWRRFRQEIETNYPLLKVTEKKAWRPS